MARIVLGSYMVRYPLGGMMSWVLQYLVGLQRLGHDVYFVEKCDYPNACYDPVKGVMTDDSTYGTKTVAALLGRFGLQDRWCFVDGAGRYHGLSQERVEAVFKSADLFVDMGTHALWLAEAADTRIKVLLDGEPGYNQMRFENRLASGEALPRYDYYFSNGRNIGTDKSTAPTAGKQWRTLFHPVVVDLFPHRPIDADAPFTTVMNWQSHEAIQFNGITYGQKDVEFAKFKDLPRATTVPLELAVAGKRVATEQLAASGWRLRKAHDVTISFDSFTDYIRRSQGEFSVCKNVFVATNSGWFSDRSAAYLASGRPVVMQDTGFSAHLPCGRGLVAVRTLAEAAAAIDEIAGDRERQSAWALDLAREYLDAPKVLGPFLRELGL